MHAVIAQSDLLTPYGQGIDLIWQGILAGRTAITSVNPFTKNLPAPPLAMVPGIAVEPGQSRVRAILDQLLAPIAGKFPANTPVILATTVGEIEAIEQSVLKNDPALAAAASPARLLKQIKETLGLTGPGMVLSSACASSAAALCRAGSMIERGQADAVLIITADAVSEFVHAGFATLLSLCDGPAKPFDAGHCGLSLGEGAAWVLVTRADSPLANADSPALLGWSSTADAIHMTAPDRGARGLIRAISQACEMARIPPQQVDLIAAHGTATLYNDTMEMLAFRTVVEKPTPAFSIKGGTGHTLAAAGLMQILVACHAMKMKVVPPTVGLTTPDKTASGWASNLPVTLKNDAVVLSTNSGFGGLNTAVVLGCNRQSTDPSRRQIARDRPGVLGIGWYSPENCGAIRAGAQGIRRSLPALSDVKGFTELIGQSPKYLARMTSETRGMLAAASLLVRLLGWDTTKSTVGIVGCEFTGWLAADQTYFRDYIDQGRSLGRANYFIYTLPTSALSEVAIALGLNGPTLHLHADQSPVTSMVNQAISMVQADEAVGVLCVFGNAVESICVAVGAGESLPTVDLDQGIPALLQQCRNHAE